MGSLLGRWVIREYEVLMFSGYGSLVNEVVETLVECKETVHVYRYNRKGTNELA